MITVIYISNISGETIPLHKFSLVLVVVSLFAYSSDQFPQSTNLTFTSQ